MKALRFVLKAVLGLAAAFVVVILAITALMAVGVIKPDVPKAPFPSVVATVTAQPRPVAVPVRAPAPPPLPPSSAPPERHWYEGGTLTNAGALEWQKATPENKLASCADLLAKLWMDGHLASNLAEHIHTVDDLQEPARQLRQGLDKAFVGDPNPKMNAKMLTNQTVPETAIIILALMHWLKT